MAVRFEERGDGPVDHSEAPLFVPSHRPADPTGRTASHRCGESDHLAVVRGVEDRGGGPRWRIMDVRREIRTDVSAHERGPSCGAEVHGVDILAKRMQSGPEVASPQDDTAVETIGEPLQDCARDGVRAIDLPEAGRPAPVSQLVVVMEGPHAIPGGGEDVAADNPECEPQDEIELAVSDSPQILSCEIL